jgi:hypothetical protein
VTRHRLPAQPRGFERTRADSVEVTRDRAEVTEHAVLPAISARLDVAIGSRRLDIRVEWRNMPARPLRSNAPTEANSLDASDIPPRIRFPRSSRSNGIPFKGSESGRLRASGHCARALRRCRGEAASGLPNDPDHLANAPAWTGRRGKAVCCYCSLAASTAALICAITAIACLRGPHTRQSRRSLARRTQRRGRQFRPLTLVAEPRLDGGCDSDPRRHTRRLGEPDRLSDRPAIKAIASIVIV